MPTTKRIQLMSGAKNYFISTWKTDNTSAGSSNNNQVKLPLESTGTYDFTVSWGDGNINKITAYNQAEVTHTYSSIDTYTITIYGTCYGWRFNNTGDRLKILDIQRWGNKFELGNSNGYFYGCSNLNISAIDTLQNPTMNTMYNGFRGCATINCSFSFLDTKNIINMYAMFNGCTALNNAGIGLLNTIACQNFTYTIADCTIFNKNISGWDLRAATTMANVLNNSPAWSKQNYDLFLIGAHAQALSTGVQSGVAFRCVPGYTNSGAAKAAHDYLSGTMGWLFTDGGPI